MEKIVIIGSGCAGLTAGIYATRANLNPLILTGDNDGGALTQTHDVENFPGFVGSIPGYEILGNMKKQAQNLGARFKRAVVIKIEQDNNHNFIIHLKNGETINSQTVIIATGTTSRWLDVEGELKFKGRGVSVCATCDGFFYKDKTVCVVGGGNTALYEANYLAGICKKVYMIHRRQEFRGSAVLVDSLKAKENVEFVLDSVINQIKGEEKVSSIITQNIVNGDGKEIELDGVFVAVGNTPNTQFVADLVEIDPNGYIRLFEGNSTSIKGLFASGDCASPLYRQAVIASSEGAKSAIEAEHYIINSGTR